MFDKLKNLFDNTPEREFVPRAKVLKKENPSPVSKDVEVTRGVSNDIDKGVLIGVDPFNGKSDLSEQTRIQSKIELLRQLQKELNGK